MEESRSPQKLNTKSSYEMGGDASIGEQTASFVARENLSRFITLNHSGKAEGMELIIY